MSGFSRFIPLTALVFLTIAPHASAQENPRADVAPIYEEGLRAMGAKDYAIAYHKFAEVTQRYPEGIGAWLELGRCEQARGRLARAYEVFRAAESAAANYGQKERSQRAAEAAKALEPRLSRWTIVVPEAVRGLPKVVVRVDGAPLEKAEWDKPIPVDGGKHVVTAEADGKRPWEKVVEVRAEGDTKTVLVDPLLDVNAASAPVLEGADVVPAKKMPALRIAGFAVGGFGLVGLAAGSIAGGIAIARHNEATQGNRPHCVDGGCNTYGAGLEAQSRTAGNLSTSMFVVGGVLFAGGAVMAFAIPSGGNASPRVAVGLGGATVTWAF